MMIPKIMTNYEEERPNPPKAKRQIQHRRKRRRVNEVLNQIDSYEDALELDQDEWEDIWEDPSTEKIPMDKKLRGYPKVYNMGHRAIKDLFEGDVVIQEKVDGSQFSFGVVESKLKLRSKRAEKFVGTNDQLFEMAAQTAYDLYKQGKLVEGWIYRGEAITRPKHNVLEYERIPKGGFVLFDVDVELENRLPPKEIKAIADNLDLEVVPTLYEGEIGSLAELKEKFLGTESFLGGANKEGIVIKNYNRFGEDGKMLMGKIVSEAFKEKHVGTSYKTSNKSIKEEIIDELTTEARWLKAIQHRREDGELEDAPRDIGPLIKEIQNDIKEEEEAYIKDKLFKYFWKDISRGVIRGFPEWYKERLAEKQFDNGN